MTGIWTGISMSLNLHNQLTEKQRQMLIRLDYVGKWDITKEEAALLIDELLEQERISIPRYVRDYRKRFKRING